MVKDQSVKLGFDRDRYLDRHETQPHYLLDVMGLSDTIYGTKAKKINLLLVFFREVKYYLSMKKGVVCMEEKNRRLILIILLVVVVLVVLSQVLPFLLGVVLLHGFSDFIQEIMESSLSVL